MSIFIDLCLGVSRRTEQPAETSLDRLTLALATLMLERQRRATQKLRKFQMRKPWESRQTITEAPCETPTNGRTTGMTSEISLLPLLSCSIASFLPVADVSTPLLLRGVFQGQQVLVLCLCLLVCRITMPAEEDLEEKTFTSPLLYVTRPLPRVLLLHTGGTLGMDPEESFEARTTGEVSLKSGTGGSYSGGLRYAEAAGEGKRG